MSQVWSDERLAGKPMNKELFAEMLQKNFEKLPDLDRNFFTYGSVYMAANSSLTGLIANSFYRRALNVTQANFSSSLPMAVLPFMTTWAVYNASVSIPLLSGTVQCPICVSIRGALVGALSGAMYPIILALPLNFGLSARYNTAPMPEKGNLSRYWLDVFKPVFRRMRAVVLLQAVFGTYLGTRDFETYGRLVELTVEAGKENVDSD